MVGCLRAGKAHDEQSRYLLAQCCMRMGKLVEAEQALLPSEADFGGVRAARWLAGIHHPLPLDMQMRLLSLGAAWQC